MISVAFRTAHIQRINKVRTRHSQEEMIHGAFWGSWTWLLTCGSTMPCHGKIRHSKDTRNGRPTTKLETLLEACVGRPGYYSRRKR